MPRGAILAMCALLIGTACVMTWQAVGLAADGAFHLVHVMGTGHVYAAETRVLANGAHQGAALLAARAGVTDTRILTMLLGAGQLVLPAIAWSLAILLSRADRLVCAAVSMVAGLSAGATWFVNVSEVVLAVPLTTLVAVLLWQPRVWGWRDVVLAVGAAMLLVASYETAVVTGTVLAVWAAWRAVGAAVRLERFGCRSIAVLSSLSVVVALWGMSAGANPTHSQSFLYYVVSLEPWPFYLGLFGIATMVAGLGPWLEGVARSVVLVLGGAMSIGAAIGLEASTVSAFQARGGAAVAGLLVQVFLWSRWIERRRSGVSSLARVRGDRHRVERLLVTIPVVFVTAMVAANVQPVRSWSRSMDAFRFEVDRSRGIVQAEDVLASDRRDVLWGWTSSSLSLIVRSSDEAGVLVDRNPAYVPFRPASARRQLSDAYVWGG